MTSSREVDSSNLENPTNGLALLLAIFLPQRAALSPFIYLSKFQGPAMHFCFELDTY